ncbi:MAG: asparaginase [Lachnotalea sp.]
MKKRILIITTGGTLASTIGKEGLEPQLNSKDILSKIEGITIHFEVEFFELFSMDSSNIQPEEWSLLAETIFKKHNQYDGIVIIHGTDTMAYTSSILSYMLVNIPIPVVLTGSQLSIANPLADAVENLRSAIHMAGSGVAGVFVAFNRKIILGCRASKLRTVSFDAFESINRENVAVINSNGLEFTNSNINFTDKEAQCTMRNHVTDKVFLLKLIPGTHPDIFDMIYKMGYKGIYIETFGIGCLPFLKRDLTEKIRESIENGLTVLVGTQCLYGGSDLEIYQTGQKILNSGVISAGDMTSEAAVTKLMWVLGQTDNKEEISEYFKTNMAGEITIA